MLQNILWGFIVIVIGLNLAPTIANSIRGATYNQTGDRNTNFSGTDTTLLGLVTTFFVIAILSVGITLVTVSFRNAGLG